MANMANKKEPRNQAYTRGRKIIRESQNERINECKITLNFMPESDGETIKTVKSILLSTYYNNDSRKIRNQG